MELRYVSTYNATMEAIAAADAVWVQYESLPDDALAYGAASQIWKLTWFRAYWAAMRTLQDVAMEPIPKAAIAFLAANGTSTVDIYDDPSEIGLHRPSNHP